MAVDPFGEGTNSTATTTAPPPATNPFARPEEDRPVFAPPGPDLIGDSWDWRTKFQTDINAQVEKWAKLTGYSKFDLDSWVHDNIDGAISFITRRVGPLQRHVERGQGSSDKRIRPGQGDDPLSPETYAKIWATGIQFFSGRLGIDLTGEIPSSGSRGSRGASGPSAADIRAMFDVDQLTDAATNMWRAWLVEEPTNAKKMAQNYIQAVVDSGGKQELDFETFIQSFIKKTARYKTVYQNKPEGVNELQYISPFVQAAQSVMGGAGGNQKAIGDVTTGGAALGASSDAFRSRLARTDENKNTAGFTNDLEARMRSVKDVLRG